MQVSRPIVYQYNSYREYLKDYVDYLKASSIGRKQGASVKRIGTELGFGSSEMFRLILQGKRNLIPERIPNVSAYFSLNKSETECFTNLVLMDQAKEPSQKLHFANQIINSKAFRRIHPLQKAQFRYFSHWYYVAIAELVGIAEFRNDPEWISRALYSQVTARDVTVALKELALLEIIKKDAQGRYFRTEKVIQSGDQLFDQSTRAIHKELIEKAVRAVDGEPRERRHISGSTLPMSKTQLKEAIGLVNQFRKELLTVLERKEESQDVYQINFQIFPLSKIKREGEPE